MKNFKIYISFLVIILIPIACVKDDFLNRQPVGVFSEEALLTKSGINGILVGAYAGLNGTMYGNGSSAGADVNTFSNWVFGSLTSDDAQKGADVGGSRSNIERYEIAAESAAARFCPCRQSPHRS